MRNNMITGLKIAHAHVTEWYIRCNFFCFEMIRNIILWIEPPYSVKNQIKVNKNLMLKYLRQRKLKRESYRLPKLVCGLYIRTVSSICYFQMDWYWVELRSYSENHKVFPFHYWILKKDIYIWSMKFTRWVCNQVLNCDRS